MKVRPSNYSRQLDELNSFSGQGSCSDPQIPRHFFFPDTPTGEQTVPVPQSVKRQRIAKAREICRECPVQVKCLTYALNWSEPGDGIWGGMTMRERTKLGREISSSVPPRDREEAVRKAVNRRLGGSS